MAEEQESTNAKHFPGMVSPSGSSIGSKESSDKESGGEGGREEGGGGGSRAPVPAEQAQAEANPTASRMPVSPTPEQSLPASTSLLVVSASSHATTWPQAATASMLD